MMYNLIFFVGLPIYLYGIYKLVHSEWYMNLFIDSLKEK